MRITVIRIVGLLRFILCVFLILAVTGCVKKSADTFNEDETSIYHGERIGTNETDTNNQADISISENDHSSGDHSEPSRVSFSEITLENTSTQYEQIVKYRADHADDRVPLENIRGIYVTAPRAGGDIYLDPLLELCGETVINAMVIDMKNENGRMTCKNAVPFMDEADLSDNYIRDISALITRLKEKNIYTIARVITFKDNAILSEHPEWYCKNPDGSVWVDSSKKNDPSYWLNPYNREVWDYIVNISSCIAELGFDEIQFDYIRFSTAKGIGNCDFGDTQGMSKTDIITEFTKFVVDALKPYGVFVSADVYGTIIDSPLDSSLVGQDYVEMSRYLDYICPMVYPSHYANGSMGITYPDLEPYHVIYGAMQASNEKLSVIRTDEGEHCAIVRPWLQDFTASYLKVNYLEYGPAEREAQIQAVYDSGLTEWLLWDAGVKYEKDGVVDN